jgi:hypothetical protein
MPNREIRQITHDRPADASAAEGGDDEQVISHRPRLTMVANVKK